MATTQRRPVADLFDMLQPVCSKGSPDVHLAPHDWELGAEDRTLCALAVEHVRPDKPYVKHGCLTCAVRAVSAGIYAVRESDATVINLGRFIDSKKPPEPTSDDPL